MNLHNASTAAITTVAPDAAGVCHALQRLLETASCDLEAQIREYPTPIPRCDAQFNHVYELRGCAVRELARLREALANHTPEQALHLIAQDVLDHAPYTDDEAEGRLRDQLQTWR